MKIISSKENKLIKKFRSLSVKKYREQFALYKIEGEKVVLEALKLGGLVETLLIKEGHEENYLPLIAEFDGEVYALSKDVFDSLSDTTTSQNIMAIVKKKSAPKIDVKSNILVLDHLQDPGNLGTIIRSCVAFGIDNIVLVESVDPYNDKTIRSASGTIFYPNFYEFSKEDFISFVKINNLNIVVAEANEKSVFDRSFVPPWPFALVIGNEGRGVSQEIRNLKKMSVSIPMAKCVESLNAGVSASILMLLLTNK